MRLILLLSAGLFRLTRKTERGGIGLLVRLAMCAAPFALSTFAQDWKTRTDLPGVQWKNATPAQKKQALDAMREFGCTCGCNLKVAQCRVEDEPCGQSRMLAEIAVNTAIKGGDVAKALTNSELARRAEQRSRVLWDPVPLNVASSPSKGPANAKVTLVEFSDFQCPYCSSAAQQLDEVVAAYPNQVRLVFKQFPLDSHPGARIAGQASLAAHAQGKFWPMHNRLFANRREITREKILVWAREAGLDMLKFTRDLDSPAVKKAVDDDQAEGERSGVEGTPTVYVNGKKYQGSLALAEFRKIVDAELANAK